MSSSLLSRLLIGLLLASSGLTPTQAFAECATASHDLLFDVGGSDQVVSACKKDRVTKDSECIRNVECRNDNAYSVITCEATSRALLFRTQHWSEKIARALTFGKCSKDRTTSDEQCSKTIDCHRKHEAYLDVTCTSVSSGQVFTAQSWSEKIARNLALGRCYGERTTRDSECLATVSCTTVRQGDPYDWAKSKTPDTADSKPDLVGVMKNAGVQISRIYKQAIADANTVRPAAAKDSEDQEKIDILIQTLKQGVSNLNPNSGTVVPATHWRARETARMIVVMSQIVSGVFEDFAGVTQTSDQDPIQRGRITAFQQALVRIRETVVFLRAAYGMKGFAGETSRASQPLVEVAQAQLHQLARALSFDKDTNGRPSYQTAVENLQAILARIAEASKSRGDTDKSLRPLVEELAGVWNNTSPLGMQELVQRALKAGGEFATEAQLLYLTLSNLGNIHGKVRFQMPGVARLDNSTKDVNP